MNTVAFCSLAFRGEAIEGLIPRIKEAGYDAVEIFGGQVDGKTDEELRGIRKVAGDCGLGILAVSPYMSLTKGAAEYAEAMETAKRFIHYGEVLGCGKIRTFTDVGPKGVGSAAATAEQWAQGIRGLKEITGMGRGFDWLLETHPLTLADTLESTQRVIREVGAANLKVLYQPTTADFMAKGGVECWRILRKDVGHMHLQNVGEGGEPGWVERGKLDVGKYLATVKADGYEGSMSVEYYWKDVPWERVKSAYDYVAGALGRKAGAGR